MKKFKKLFAMLLTLAMVMGMSVTTFAAEYQRPEPSDAAEILNPTESSATPSSSDKVTAKVLNVEKDAVVTAYHIVTPKYDNGFIGYEKNENLTANISDVLNISAAEITAIANEIEVLATNVAATNFEATNMLKDNDSVNAEGLATFTGELGAGYWMIIVSGTVDEIYNPMLLGVYYSKSGSDNTMTMDPVDANSKWQLVAKDVYPKSTEPSVTKEIVNEDDTTANHSSATAGEKVTFRIKTAIPSYSADYTNVTVKITDTLDKGLKLDQSNFKVIIEETTYTELNETGVYKTENVTNNGFELTIESAYALIHPGADVTVEYEAEVLNINTGDDSNQNFVGNKNTAKLTYTNNPGVIPDGETGTKDTPEKKTYTYTFAIGANLYGKQSTKEWNKETEEIVKTGELREIENSDGTPTETNTLPGATFTLTKMALKEGGNKDNDTDWEKLTGNNNVRTAISDDEGKLSFTGLSEGHYLLEEIAAPDGYSVNEADIPVVISANYDADGKLTDYTITINGNKTSTYTATYEGETIKNITSSVGNKVSDTYEFLNTKLSSLPSTGGIGTTIFTVGGCAIMILAAGLYFASRRKSAK